MVFQVTIEIKDSDLRAEAKEWLDNMFLGHFFDVTLIQKMMEHLNMNGFRDSRLYTYLHSLHCVHYDKMKPETLSKCKEICYKIIGVNPDPKEVNPCDLV